MRGTGLEPARLAATEPKLSAQLTITKALALPQGCTLTGYGALIRSNVSGSGSANVALYTHNDTFSPISTPSATMVASSNTTVSDNNATQLATVTGLSVAVTGAEGLFFQVDKSGGSAGSTITVYELELTITETRATGHY